MANGLIDFVGRLRSDSKFRKRFIADPAATLEREGIDTSVLDLPTSLNEGELLERLKAAEDRGDGRALADAEIAGLDPDELWRRFGIIGWSREASAAAAAGRASIAAAVVIYGVAVVIGSNVVVVGKEFVATVGQLRILRQLARTPPKDLRFSIQGPDGAAVAGVPFEAVAALIERMKPPGR